MKRDLGSEVAGALLGDARLSARAAAIVSGLASNPKLSFPDAFKTDSALEAAYRFLRNPKVSMERLLEPHLNLTAAYARICAGPIVVAHDTTDFTFSSPREGMGDINGETKGYFCHTSLAMEVTNDARSPIGIIGAKQWARIGPRKGKRSAAQTRSDPTNETRRWIECVEAAEERLGAARLAIHVMDREADNYEHFAAMVASGARFVVRANHNRATGTRLMPIATRDLDFTGSAILQRTVKLSPRSNTGTRAKIYPSRRERVAKLAVVSKTVSLLRPQHLPGDVARKVSLNFVLVTEVDCPTDQTPVAWRLWTTEPVRTQADMAHVVDFYRARWLIEELFKALKSGCNYEKRQLESHRTLTNALGLFLPIAVNLLKLRALGRDAATSQLPARVILAASTIEALRACSVKRLPDHPTVSDAMMAIAKLGGHITNNGAPGWQVLWRGYEHFLAFQQGWDSARQARVNPVEPRCDQS